jgi:hypothetical protein
LSVTVWQNLNSDARNYWDNGRGLILFRYFVLSYSLAGLGWLSNPENFLWLFPSLKLKHATAFDGLIIGAIYILPLVWLLVVISGIKKTGWPGIVLVFPFWWGMWWWNMTALLMFVCLTGRDCL